MYNQKIVLPYIYIFATQDKQSCYFHYTTILIKLGSRLITLHFDQRPPNHYLPRQKSMLYILENKHEDSHQ